MKLFETPDGFDTEDHAMELESKENMMPNGAIMSFSAANEGHQQQANMDDLPKMAMSS
jgi:hypothetical protein